jgi:hypothetical protein
MARALDTVLTALAAVVEDADPYGLLDILWLAAAQSAAAKHNPPDGPHLPVLTTPSGARTASVPDLSDGIRTALSLPPIEDSPNSPSVVDLLPDDQLDICDAQPLESAPEMDLVPVTPVPLHGQSSATADSLETAQALRPFKRLWRRGKRTELDLDATVTAYALTGRLVPTFRAAPERWFDVHVIIDSSPSMLPWSVPLDNLIDVLVHTSSFRSVTRWWLVTSDTGCMLLDETGRTTPPEHLGSPLGRDLILLCSDYAMPAWRAGAAWEMVRSWGQNTPTALVNVLPLRLWKYSLPGLDVVQGWANLPGARNRDLEVSVEPPGPAGVSTSRRAMPVPVVSLAPWSLTDWATALMDGHRSPCEVVLIPPRQEFDEHRFEDEDVAPTERAAAFLATASAPAARIATLCSVLPRITLGILELIQSEFVLEAREGDISELLISGLFVLDSPHRHAELVLRFRDQVQEALSRHLSA